MHSCESHEAEGLSGLLQAGLIQTPLCTWCQLGLFVGHTDTRASQLDALGAGQAGADYACKPAQATASGS